MTEQTTARRVPARPLVAFDPLLGGRPLLAYGGGLDGTLVLLTAEAPREETRARRDAEGVVQLFNGTPWLRHLGRSGWPNAYHLHRLHPDDTVTHTALPPCTDNFRVVLPLTAGRTLLVRTPEYGRDGADASDDEGDDRNAVVVAADGTTLGAFPVGPCQEVQVARDGSVWVGYVDQDIMGTDRAAGGLLRLTEDGAAAWAFNETDLRLVRAALEAASTEREAVSDHIFDCYAVTAAEDGSVWTVYYTDFPVVRVANDAVTHAWGGVPLSGPHRFAVDAPGGDLLVASGYAERGRFFRTTLTGGTREEVVPTDTSGTPLVVVGVEAQGSRLLLETGDGIWAFALADCR